MSIILCEYSTANMTQAESLFQCAHCGACCTSLHAAILCADEPARLAAIMGITVKAFSRRYTSLVDGHISMRLPCPFYKDGCSIYAERPRVCREYPLNYIHRIGDKGYITVAEKCQASGALVRVRRSIGAMTGRQ